MIGDRQRHRDLAIVSLAEPSAILSRHAHRMHALLHEARVVDDPSFDPALRLHRRHLQRSRTVHVTQHLSQTLDITNKTRFARSRLVFHPRRRDPIKRITRISKISTERIWKNE